MGAVDDFLFDDEQWTMCYLVANTGLALLGGVAARVGGARVTVGAMRVTFWGALAMGLTAGVGALFGTVA
jgi:VIT1/CCC1 family predicted Fe2+/Mn2+ transporter